jgi:hypothetical protein
VASGSGLASADTGRCSRRRLDPDSRWEAAEKQAGDGMVWLVAGAAEQVLREPFEKFYAAQTATAAGDVVRGIDTLANARFVRTVIEGAQLNRSERPVCEFSWADADLNDATLAADITTEAFECSRSLI